LGHRRRQFSGDGRNAAFLMKDVALLAVSLYPLEAGLDTRLVRCGTDRDDRIDGASDGSSLEMTPRESTILIGEVRMVGSRFLACVAIAVIGFSGSALAQSPSPSPAPSMNPSNPNCSPGVKGCTANAPTSDVSRHQPPQNSPYDPSDDSNSNCNPAQRSCGTNHPTGNVTTDNPTKAK
jgi:hypothetical protein